eukprot:g8436.t1
MRLLVTALMMGGAVFVATATRRQSGDCEITLKLVDATSGGELAGLIRIRDEAGKVVPVAGLMSRGTGLTRQKPLAEWFVLPKSTTVRLPRKKLTIEAFSGLETEAVTRTIDLTGGATTNVTLRLKRFYNARAKGFRSGNTHLHLQKISREECDRYLREVPRGDGLDVLFVSYLERAVADRQYTSNRYRKRELEALGKSSGVVMGNGEEHRHNFAGFGQGYGHVMFLNIKKLIQPVSIGPGIMKVGTDGLPLRRGIDTARKDGATVVWCHNNWGMEALPNFLAGRVDAQNIFDGGTHGSYKDSFYRYLNAGLNVPFSTGTDWFMYDFSRVYCDMRGDLTVGSWLKTLAAGRNYISNGPLMEFQIDGKRIGDTVAKRKPGTVAAKARVLCRNDFKRLEIVCNGKVVARVNSRKVGGHYEAEFAADLPISGPCWFALRTPPPPVKGDPTLTEKVNVNELGRELFAHSSAIHVTIAGKSRFDTAVARRLLAEMIANQKSIAKHGKFADKQERARVLDADVAAYKPKYVTILLGMNDGRYTPYNEEIFRTYHKDMTEVVARIKKTGATPILMTPTMFDSRAARIRGGRRAADKSKLELYNSVLAYYGTWLREVAVKNGYGFVDMYSPLNNLTLQKRKTEPNFTLIADAVHPGPSGQLVMAYAIIDDMGLRGPVSNIRILGATSKQPKAQGRRGKVTNLKKTENGLTFTFLAKSLPWVLPEEAKVGVEILKLGHRASREGLEVHGLKPGRYELTIDGKHIGVYTHTALSRHIELQANEKTPQYQQALKIAELNKQRNAGPVRALRGEWSIFQRYSRAAAQLKANPNDKNAQKQVDAWKQKLAGRDQRIAKAEADAKKIEDEIFKINKPKPRTYVLKPAQMSKTTLRLNLDGKPVAGTTVRNDLSRPRRLRHRRRFEELGSPRGAIRRVAAGESEVTMRLSPETRKSSVAHLRKHDAQLKPVIRAVGPFTLRPAKNRFEMLVRSIISQQISVSAARSIRTKLFQLVEHEVSAERVQQLSDEQIRGAGVSPQKLRYLRDLSEHVVDGELPLGRLGRLSDAAAIERLVRVKGIGEWTAQMFLIFALGRLDVLPHADVGIQNAIQALYGLSDRPNRATIEEIARPWRPFASVASWYCWRSLDSMPK